MFSFMCMICRSFVVILSFFFGHCVVCPSTIYEFRLPLCYLQSFRTPILKPELVSICVFSSKLKPEDEAKRRTFLFVCLFDGD